MTGYRGILLVFLLTSILSCTKEVKAPIAVSAEGYDAESVYLTTNNVGEPVVVWTETDTVSQKTRLYYAVSGNSGKTFDKKVEVPISSEINTHAEGMPKVAFTKDDKVIAAWETSTPTPQNKYAGAIYFVVSKDHGKSWSAQKFLHSDTLAGRSRGFFDLSTLPDGSVGATWLDVKTDMNEKGRSIRFAKTNSDGKFQSEKMLEPFACECCRTDLFVNHDGSIHVAYRSVRKGNLNQLIRDMAWVHSYDNGNSFSSPEIIHTDNWVMDKCPHTGPTLCGTGESIHAVWYSEGSGIGIFYSSSGKNGSTPREQISHTAAHPQIVAVDNNVCMVYEEVVANQSHIVMQLRNEYGMSAQTVSPPGIASFFPVATPSGDGHFCIAYLGRSGKNASVFVKKS